MPLIRVDPAAWDERDVGAANVMLDALAIRLRLDIALSAGGGECVKPFVPLPAPASFWAERCDAELWRQRLDALSLSNCAGPWTLSVSGRILQFESNPLIAYIVAGGSLPIPVEFEGSVLAASKPYTARDSILVLPPGISLVAVVHCHPKRSCQAVA